jgi:hypothetical protein
MTRVDSTGLAPVPAGKMIGISNTGTTAPWDSSRSDNSP